MNEGQKITKTVLDNIEIFDTETQGQILLENLENVLKHTKSKKIQEMANNLKEGIITTIKWSNKSEIFHKEKNRSHSIDGSGKEQIKQYTEITNNFVEKFYRNKKLNIKM